jgi:hypothetical protein
MFKLSFNDRIARWKKFREKLNSFTLEQSCYATIEFWHTCPFCPYYLQYENYQTWPDPWQLIQENYYCDLAKCLGIVYTLYLTSHQGNLHPEIRVYNDPTTRYNYHIAYLCDGKYVLNLIEGEVVNKEHINQKLKLKYCYTAVDLKLEQY